MEVPRTSNKQVASESHQQAQGPLAVMLNIIEKYKTNKCTNPDCRYNREKMFDTDGLLLYDCFDFHSKTDQRRPVLVKVNKTKVASGSLLYSKNVALEVLLGQKPNENSEKHCLNGYEYLYHPLNYKTLECHVNKSGKCNTTYCPYYHSPDEQAYFEEYRKIIDHNTSKFPLVEEIQNNLNKINDIVRRTNNDNLNNLKDSPEPLINGKDEKSALSAQADSNQLKVKAKPNGDYYVYDDTVKFIEDHYHEFKCLKLHLDTVIKYIGGFLNSKGGTLYFGINNDGVVKGTDVKEYEIQSFKKKLYEALKKFAPPIGEDEVKANFVPVYKSNKGQGGLFVMQNSYVIEFIIKKPTKNDLFFTNYKECYVKRSASINQLKTKEIKEYVKTFIQRRSTETLEALDQKLVHYEGRKLDGLNEADLEALEKQLQETLRKVEEALNPLEPGIQTCWFQIDFFEFLSQGMSVY